jgi:hypothetical protein
MSNDRKSIDRVLMLLAAAAILSTCPANAAFSLKSIAQTGEQAAGFSPGVTYFQNGNEAYLDSAGRVIFQFTTLQRTDSTYSFTDAWWETEPAGGAAIPFVRSGDQIPGFPALHYSVYSARVGDGGAVAFQSGLVTDTHTTVDYGVFVGTPGGIHLAARSGVPIAELGGGTFHPHLGTSPATNGSKTAFLGAAYLNSNPTPTEGIWLASADGTIQTLALAGGTLNTDIILEGIDKNSRVGFLANTLRLYTVEVAGPVRQAAYTGQVGEAAYTATGAWAFMDLETLAHLYVLHPNGTLKTLAEGGQQAPGLPAGFSFKRFDTVLPSCSANNVTFRAALIGPGVNDIDEMSSFAFINGELRLLSRPGMPAPQLGPDVLFWHFAEAVVNDAGQVLIESLLQGPGITAANDRAIWYDDGDGVMRLLLREGDPFSFDGITKTVLGFWFSGASIGSRGTDAFNNSGQFVCSISFTDGSSGVFLFQIPEPSAALLALGGIALLGAGWRRRR